MAPVTQRGVRAERAVAPRTAVSGTIRVPGDKSVSHRALIFAALAEGRSRIADILDSADIRSTATVLRTLGVEMPELSSDVVITGVGLRGFRAPVRDLDCGNSGTTTRLMAGAVASYDFRSMFVGDASLSRRPMRRLAAPLGGMGARVVLTRGDGLPMEITGGPMRSIDWVNETASAQVKSAILLAGVTGGVAVRIRAPRASRDHTERFLRALGATVETRDGGRTVSLEPPALLPASDVRVPADPSSAAFFAALAAVADEGTIVLPDVLASASRDGFFRALEHMGAGVTSESGPLTAAAAGESTVRYTISPPADGMHGITLGADDVPAMIDELPLLACVAARAGEGEETVVTGAAELRVKESDRIGLTVANLRAVGAEAEELSDGFRVRGVGRRPLCGSVVTHGDHRIAMAFGVLGAIAGNDITVDNPSCVAVSYPRFWDDLRRAAGRAGGREVGRS
jgi:3-phosphoshikimate 1-carboxyvinyltransferase